MKKANNFWERTLILMIFLLFSTCLFSQSDLLKKKYKRIDIFRHATEYHLELKEDHQFIINETNIKGKFLIQGEWNIDGDSLVLNFKLRGKKSRKPFKKEALSEYLQSKKYFIAPDRLFDDIDRKCGYYSIKEWRKNGKSCGGLKF